MDKKEHMTFHIGVNLSYILLDPNVSSIFHFIRNILSSENHLNLSSKLLGETGIRMFKKHLDPDGHISVSLTEY